MISGGDSLLCFSSSLIYLLFVFVLFIYFISLSNNKINNKNNNFFEQACERHTWRTVLRTSQYLLSLIRLLSFYGRGASEDGESVLRRRAEKKQNDYNGYEQKDDCIQPF